MIGGSKFLVPVGSLWREHGQGIVRVVAHDPDGTVYVRNANNTGTTRGVNPAWFETWERCGQ